jgi:hypothetical protein
MHVLHDQPIDRLAVLAEHSRGFDKFSFKAGDRVGVGVGVEVDCYCVDHIRGLKGWEGCGWWRVELKVRLWGLEMGALSNARALSKGNCYVGVVEGY